jgi:hypothetical protein
LPVTGATLGAASMDRQSTAPQIDTTEKDSRRVDLAGRRLT